MATNVEIPTQPGRPFTESVTLQNVTYVLRFKWNTVAQAWTVDIYDETETLALLRGMPLVTGCDLLEQFAYMPLGAQLILTVMTIGPGLSPDQVPAFNDLGVDGHLFGTMP